MTVDEAGTVDAIGLEDETGKVVLTIADHLDWSDETGHALKLQEKLNRYLSFIESEEIFDAYPEARGRIPMIDVVLRVQSSAAGSKFLAEVHDIVTNAGIELRVTWFPGD